MDADAFKKTLQHAFEAEASELLEKISQLLAQVWHDDVAKELFRHFHSLKGTSQLLEYGNFSLASQSAETLAATGSMQTAEELNAIYRYLYESLQSIKTEGREAEAYELANADRLIASIATHEITAQQEQQALFSLFAKHINSLDKADHSTQRSQLRTLGRAADLMQLNELSNVLENMSQSSAALSNNLSQQLLTALSQHPSFGSAFIHYLQKTKP